MVKTSIKNGISLKHVLECMTHFNGIIVQENAKFVGIYEIFKPKDLFTFIKRRKYKKNF